MTGCTSGAYDQLETSPELIEQELRPAVCERRQTDLWRIRPCSHHRFETGTVPEPFQLPVFTSVPMRCDRSGTVPEPFRLALWCERSTGPVPEQVQSARSLRVHVCRRARARA